MTARKRFTEPTDGGCEEPAFEDTMAVLYRVLRDHPEARMAVEEAFHEMANRQATETT